MGALMLAFLGPRPAAAAEPVREQSDLVLSPAGWKLLEVENLRGQIDVRRSADGRFHLVAIKTMHGRTRRQSAELARQVEVTTDRDQERFLIVVHYPQRSDVRIGFWDLLSGVEFPRVQVRLEIEAPEGLPLRLRSSSGDLSTEDRSGPQSIETRSGDVTVRGARGPLDITTTSGDLSAVDIGAARVRTSSGDITVNGARGPLTARATSGDIQVKGAADSLHLSSSSGDIEVDAAPRGLGAETSSGDIAAPWIARWAMLRSTSGEIGCGLHAPLARAELSSLNGSVTARLAAGLGCDLDARTSSGTIDVGVPLTLGTVDRHAVSGKVAGGGAPVVLHTSSGDIVVESGGR
jgi:DUF4097 and DUF4098 domain-containing protein YvlB